MSTATVQVKRAVEKITVSTRIRSVDIVRGAVIVLMAIDHVRVYAGLPPGGPDPGIFFTRWITHFCAPAFVFLAGTSAFLYGQKIQNRHVLARYLLTRGLILVVLELTLIRFFWTFNLHFEQFVLAGVIWMLGWCMVLMAALVYLRPIVVGVLGLVIITFQQAFSLVPTLVPASSQRTFGYIWEFIYTSGMESWSGITILYVLVPWIGVMAAGYGFGIILLLPKQKRRRLCLWIGISATILFVVIGTAIILSQNPNPDAPPFIFQLLNQRKYPASQLYLLMTLGPTIAVIPLVENAKGWLAKVLETFGSVPMFYYLMHILIIHITALIVTIIREGKIFSAWYTNAPYSYVPEEYQWSLGLLYLVFMIDVILLYFLCRWYAQYKFNHHEKKWLKFL
ncbi:MAG: DUF1624 domain-containing protein [Flavitalea sp.]